MLLPYRVKNPVKRLPLATLLIIAINILVYIFTTDYFVVIKESVVNQYAFALGKTPFLNFITAAFLHADPFHLIGNMLFLWVFGPPVEDRLGIPRYLLLYFATGLCGDLMQGAMDMTVHGSASMGIGASGCIMGVLGAYWMIFSWSTVCVFYWIWWFWHGVWEVQAIWIIGLYLLMDLAEGILFGLSRFSGGVAYFAHVGGGVSGILLVMLMRIKRDSEALSDAKAIQADMKDMSLLPFHALQPMLKEDPQNPELIRAIIKPALSNRSEGAIHEAFSDAGNGLVEKDPEIVIYYLLTLKGDAKIYKPEQILRLAGLRERALNPAEAMRLYQILFNVYPSEPEIEMALYRMALCFWKTYNDPKNAAACLNELKKRYPQGQMIPYAWDLWKQMNAGKPPSQ